jgi:iron complex transport system permease protein
VLNTNPPTRRRVLVVIIVTVIALCGAVVCGLAIGPTPISTMRILGSLFSHLGVGHSTLNTLQSTIIWQLRAPRLVLNPLADPYLLGVAAGAGLGATFAIMDIGGGNYTPTWTPLLAFAGALVAVTITWSIGGRGMRSNAATLILSGVAVSALLTSMQTFLQQQASANSIARVYIWLLGSLASASWSSVDLVLPYVLVCVSICVVCGRALDVMSVGEDESRSLGVPVRRVRLIVIGASSLGTAAIVSAVGLIGFVGIIVPHIVRLLVGTSYRRILPISVLFGAAFLVFADTVARTVIAPSELPLGVVTALIGAPVFVVILSLRRQMAR